MTISKALITAAGRDQRHLPLQTIVDREGYPRSVLTQLIEEAVSAGIESIGIVISPGDEELYHRAAGDHAKRLTFIEQETPAGYGDAIHRGREFFGNDHFLLMVSDHLYISRDPAKSCARQLVETASAERCVVSAVQSTHESNLSAFGAGGGRLFDGRPGIYEVERVIEKPTPTQAEQQLIVPGLRMAHYLCFFGMHVLSPLVVTVLGGMLKTAPDPRSVSLASALEALDGKERHLAVELQGRRYDLDERYGLLTAQLALALDGEQRAEILAQIVSRWPISVDPCRAFLKPSSPRMSGCGIPRSMISPSVYAHRISGLPASRSTPSGGNPKTFTTGSAHCFFCMPSAAFPFRRSWG